MSVAQVCEMSAAEFDMWMIRAGSEPFSARRTELYLAQICMWLHNVNAKRGKNLKEFLLFEKTQPVVIDETVDDKARDVMGKLVNLNAKVRK